MEALRNKLHLSLSMDHPDDQFSRERSPASVKDVKDMILASSKSILGKVLSPAKEKFGSRDINLLHFKINFFSFEKYNNKYARLTITI